MRMETMYCWKSCAISSTTVKNTLYWAKPMMANATVNASIDHHEEEEAVNLYIMKVVESEEDGEEIEEFLPVEDEDLLEKLIEVVQADFEADEELDDE